MENVFAKYGSKFIDARIFTVTKIVNILSLCRTKLEIRTTFYGGKGDERQQSATAT